MLQCVTVCCSVLQRLFFQMVFVHGVGSYSLRDCRSVLQCGAMCCNVFQCVAARCSALQCLCCIGGSCMESDSTPFVSVAVCCRVLQCVAVCCSVLQCIAVCCVFQSEFVHRIAPYLV